MPGSIKRPYQKLYINGPSCVLNSCLGQGRSTLQIIRFHRACSSALVPSLYCLLATLWIKQPDGHLVLFCSGFERVDTLMWKHSLPYMSTSKDKEFHKFKACLIALQFFSFVMTITKFIKVSCSLSSFSLASPGL